MQFDLTTLLQSTDIETTISDMYKQGLPVWEYVDAITDDWENNIDFLVQLNKLIPDHPEWVRLGDDDLDIFFFARHVYRADDMAKTEQNLEQLISLGLMKNTFVIHIITDIIHDGVEGDLDHAFKQLAILRDISSRHPNWNFTCACENYIVTFPKVIEHLMTEGYLTAPQVQYLINYQAIVGAYENLKELPEFIREHPELGIFIYTDIPDVVLKFGEDVTCLVERSVLCACLA